MGHALRKVLGVIAVQQGRELAEVATAANAQIVSRSSLKAALDRNWDNPTARQEALVVVLAAPTQVERWLETQPESKADPVVQLTMKTAQQIKAQDVVMHKAGTATLRKGGAKDRRISIADAQMRHGRKSRSVRVDGYKRQVLHDLDSGLVRAVGMTPANIPEASVAEAIRADLSAQQAQLAELHIDRAYLSSIFVRERSADLAIYCKAWPIRNGSRFLKTAFELDWQQQRIRCPNQQEMPFEAGGTVHFPGAVCAACPLREHCTFSCCLIT